MGAPSRRPASISSQATAIGAGLATVGIGIISQKSRQDEAPGVGRRKFALSA